MRDWLHVEDHAEALALVLQKGEPGWTYNIGGNSERRNIDVVHEVCALLDEMVPDPCNYPRIKLIQLVSDRPGHDERYAIDAGRIDRELGWRPKRSFEEGLKQTVRWYLDNESWWGSIMGGTYDGRRMGLKTRC